MSELYDEMLEVQRRLWDTIELNEPRIKVEVSPRHFAESADHLPAKLPGDEVEIICIEGLKRRERKLQHTASAKYFTDSCIEHSYSKKLNC